MSWCLVTLPHPPPPTQEPHFWELPVIQLFTGALGWFRAELLVTLQTASCFPILLLFCSFIYLRRRRRTKLGPNEVDVKDLSSLPNASKKDSAAPAIQKYADPPKGKNKVRKHMRKSMLKALRNSWVCWPPLYILPCLFYCTSPQLGVCKQIPLPSAGHCKVSAEWTSWQHLSETLADVLLQYQASSNSPACSQTTRVPFPLRM